MENKTLELLAVEIIKPCSKPFLVVYWYRPPSSPVSVFNAFQNVIDKIDAENVELYPVGDMNCDVLSTNPANKTTNLLNISNIYDLNQIISEPTRITNTSKTLIDLR